jgi:hypothetical protein
MRTFAQKAKLEIPICPSNCVQLYPVLTTVDMVSAIPACLALLGLTAEHHRYGRAILEESTALWTQHFGTVARCGLVDWRKLMKGQVKTNCCV